MQLLKETYFSNTYSMKRSIYNFLVQASAIVLWPTRFFSPKMRLFLDGRKGVFKELSNKIGEHDKTIWFHCASLGEYEQGLPIMEAVRKMYPGHKLVLSFFSPSGYEVRKNAPIADVVTYLPLDTRSNATKFIKTVHPELAFFVKYEFWPNYLFELKNSKIPVYLISGIFSKDQAFFKAGGNILRDALKSFHHFFVQDKESLQVLKQLGFENASLSGDTRFDRVSKQIEMNNHLDFMEPFIGNSICIVCGSTWPEDEEALLPYMNEQLGQKIKFVIAPHKMDESKITEFQGKLKLPSVRYSEREKKLLSQNQVLILDTIGLLSKTYSYADIAYVGGAMGNTGLHNILEAATFGIPVIIGKNYKNFPEAIKLEDLAGLYSISSSAECTEILSKFVNDSVFREKTGMICGHYVNSNTGATKIVMSYLESQKSS